MHNKVVALAGIESYPADLDKLAERIDGYSGADISYVCKKAAAIPFKESIETGIERDINMDDILQAMDEVGSSLDIKSIELYENYA